MSDTVEVELVGGPCDGQKVAANAGEFFVYVAYSGGFRVYGVGDDGRYYYCPEISSNEPT